MENNVLNQEGKEDYYSRMFTDNGIKVLHNYLKQLTEIWYSKKEYPLKVGKIFGIPNFMYSNIFKNKDELMGRIKMLGQILGVKEVEFNLNNTTIKINLEGEQNGRK
jgi:hypothetical protein